MVMDHRHITVANNFVHIECRGKGGIQLELSW